jgi:hypothetical protein
LSFVENGPPEKSARAVFHAERYVIRSRFTGG